MGRPSLKLASHTVTVPRLTPGQRDGMWALFHRYYEDVSREAFERDLAAKSHVIELRDSGDGSLQGFSTLHTYRRAVEGRSIGVLYSGDTIIAQPYWGQTALQKAWLAKPCAASCGAHSCPPTGS